MRRTIIRLAVLLAAVPLAAQEPSGAAATYIANEGFLVESGDACVLVDAVFTESWGRYATPGAETLDAMRRGQKPFDAVDLFLVTHHHADHFHPAHVLEFMRNNSRVVLLAPADAVEMLKKETGYEGVARRVTAITPPRGKVDTRTVNGITVSVFPLRHYDDDAGAVQHLGFVWKAGGSTFFHAGDAALDDAAEYGPLTAGSGIDLAFLPRWLLEDWARGRALLERIRPKAAFFLHAAVTDSGRFKALAVDRAGSLTTALVPERRMETFRFSVTEKRWTAD